MATRKYELMVILDPLRTEDQQKETLTKIDETITKYGGTPEKQDVWGKRRLAYSINKRRDGYYAVITFDAGSTETTLAEVDRFCRITEEILRHQMTQAVVGKSAGNPALYKVEERPMRSGPPRWRRDQAPAAAAVEAAPAAEAAAADAPAAEAPAAPAEA